MKQHHKTHKTWKSLALAASMSACALSFAGEGVGYGNGTGGLSQSIPTKGPFWELGENIVLTTVGCRFTTNISSSNPSKIFENVKENDTHFRENGIDLKCQRVTSTHTYWDSAQEQIRDNATSYAVRDVYAEKAGQNATPNQLGKYPFAKWMLNRGPVFQVKLDAKGYKRLSTQDRNSILELADLYAARQGSGDEVRGLPFGSIIPNSTLLTLESELKDQVTTLQGPVSVRLLGSKEIAEFLVAHRASMDQNFNRLFDSTEYTFVRLVDDSFKEEFLEPLEQAKATFFGSLEVLGEHPMREAILGCVNSSKVIISGVEVSHERVAERIVNDRNRFVRLEQISWQWTQGNFFDSNGETIYSAFLCSGMTQARIRSASPKVDLDLAQGYFNRARSNLVRLSSTWPAPTPVDSPRGCPVVNDVLRDFDILYTRYLRFRSLPLSFYSGEDSIGNVFTSMISEVSQMKFGTSNQDVHQVLRSWKSVCDATTQEKIKQVLSSLKQ